MAKNMNKNFLVLIFAAQMKLLKVTNTKGVNFKFLKFLFSKIPEAILLNLLMLKKNLLKTVF